MDKNFVDLSKLPRRANGNYNWEQSIGLSFPFYYNDIKGYIQVLDYDKKTCKVTIYIKNYTSKSGVSIYNSQLVNCILGKILMPKIALTHPNIVQYLDNPDDAFKYTKGSGKYVITTCPICKHKKMMKVNHLTSYGFSCDICGDGVSYPNKFMRSLLNQIQIVFIPELSKLINGFQWVGNYRYDFYFEYEQNKYFVEMDGAFHFHNPFNTLQNVLNSDHNKNLLAEQHGIKIIRINCDYASLDERFDYIKNSILNSELYHILHLESKYIDWVKCDMDGARTLIQSVCEMWNNKVYTTLEIANKLNIAPATVRAYLRNGTKLGLTYYDGKKERSLKRAETNKKIAENNKKPFVMYKDNCLVGVFSGCSDLVKQSVQLFGKQFNKGVVAKACKGDIKSAYGYTMKRISKEEFNQYISLNNNNLLIIGG